MRAAASTIPSAYLTSVGVRGGERPRKPCLPPLPEDVWARKDARPPVRVAGQAASSDLQATCEPSAWEGVATYMRPSSHPHATLMRPSCDRQATPKPPATLTRLSRGL